MWIARCFNDFSHCVAYVLRQITLNTAGSLSASGYSVTGSLEAS